MTRPNASANDDARPSLASHIDYEAFPPWLASLITHMGLIILLGLAIQAAPARPAFDLAVSLDGDPGLADLDAGGGGDPLNDSIDLPVVGDLAPAAMAANDAEVALAVAPVAELVDVQVDSLLAAAPSADQFAVETASLLAASDGTVPGKGDGGSGAGSGGGHGDGIGTGVGNGRGPGRAMTSMFGLAGEGGDFVYAFDRSHSMNSVYSLEVDGVEAVSVTPLEAAKNELNRSLGDLNKSCRFQVVFYNDIAVTFGNSLSLAAATLNNIERVRSFIYQMPAASNTNHLVALDQAIRCRPQVIFLLTDGEEKDDPSPAEIRRLVQDCKEAKIKVNIVHFCAEVRTMCSLRQLAQETGGEHKFITMRELAEAKLHASRGTPNLRAVESLAPLE
ncbi:VWA domain-containing protein [Lacipirellula limnantheis]|uniref:VWFA domain-containing protein n=1 Tax=Lacipirellula limnantheis TaxID=2528024 RepID=A0A517U6L6_9BACT|nr:VWA domain-containing protein [Lacipirellula limnantheis]QDT76272.1 hypothetical protein I41_55220 [Lacipirellula limnantheis]